MSDCRNAEGRWPPVGIMKRAVMVDDTGKELAKAPGTALLGHPLNVLPWLAEDLAKRGKRLQAGDIVEVLVEDSDEHDLYGVPAARLAHAA